MYCNFFVVKTTTNNNNNNYHYFFFKCWGDFDKCGGEIDGNDLNRYLWLERYLYLLTFVSVS
jgi:hypothetical protein